MGTESKAVLLCLRIWELICSVIVIGILAAFLDRVDDGDGPRDGRIIYALVTACVSTVFSLVFIVPFLHSFFAFPGDFILWIMWLVAFCLLDTRTGVHTCSTPWFTNYWGFYWGRRWRRPFVVPVLSGSGCAEWRTALAFCFMAMFAFLVSTIVGGLAASDHWKEKRKERQTGGEAKNVRRAGIGQPLTAA